MAKNSQRRVNLSSMDLDLLIASTNANYHFANYFSGFLATFSSAAKQRSNLTDIKTRVSVHDREITIRIVVFPCVPGLNIQ